MHGLVAHPCREGFVQPDIVPPFRRHQIAKPLVGQLVRMGRQRAALLAERGALINQECRFAVDDRARILHSAIGKVRRGDEVELGVWVWIVEIFFLYTEHFKRGFMRRFELVALSFGRERPQHNLAVTNSIGWNVAAGKFFIGTNCEGDEIGLDWACRCKLVFDPTIFFCCGRHFRGVRDDRIISWCCHADGPGRLEARLVKAWESAARINRLHLGGEIRLARLLCLIKPCKTEIERRSVFQLQCDIASWYLIFKRQAGHPAFSQIAIKRAFGILRTLIPFRT